MKKEFICFEETVIGTQKKIRQWVSSGYKIEIIAQNILNSGSEAKVVTSLWRWKEEQRFDIENYKRPIELPY